jgi:hypothetical protein
MKHPRLWWRAMMDHAQETQRPLDEVIHEYSALMNFSLPAMSTEEADHLSFEYPYSPQYIHRCFQGEP